MKKNGGIVKTREISLAVLFITYNIDLVDIIWHGDNAFFEFKETSKCAELEAGYYNNSIKVNPREYWENFRQLKKMMYDKKRTLISS